MSLRLHWGFRIVFGLLAALLTGSILVTPGAGVGLLPSFLILLFLVIMLYEEAWDFNRREGTVVHSHGIILLKRRRFFPREKIASLNVSAFRKGSIGGEEKKRFFQKDLVRFSLLFEDSGRKDIEITEARHGAGLQRRAAVLAEFMRIPYSSEL